MCGPSSAKPHALSVIGSFFSLWEDWGHSFFLSHKDWLNEWEQLWAWALRKCVLPGYHGSKLLPCVIRAELSQKNKGSPGVARMMVFSYVNQFLQICFLPPRWIAKGIAGHHPSNLRFTNVPYLLFMCRDGNDNDYNYHNNDEGLPITPILALR